MCDILPLSIRSVGRLLEGLTATEKVKLDLGLYLNIEHGRRLFEPGEMMQFSCRVDGLKVWVGVYAGDFRVAFGEAPMEWCECEALSADEARQVIMKTVGV